MLHALQTGEEGADAALKCPPHIAASMAQDASVKVRRAACKLWLAYHKLDARRRSPDEESKDEEEAESRTELPAAVKQVLMARSHDKCAPARAADRWAACCLLWA